MAAAAAPPVTLNMPGLKNGNGYGTNTTNPRAYLTNTGEITENEGYPANVNENAEAFNGTRKARRAAVCGKKNWETATNMNQTNAECIFTRSKTLEGISSQEKPYAIIKYGPTGSGKGSGQMAVEIQNLGVDIEDSVVLEIDALVESIKNYRNKTIRIKNTFNRYTYPNAKKEMYKKLGQAYNNTRRAGPGLGSYLDETLDKAIQSNKHIIFETTGTAFFGANPIGWLIEKVRKNKNYKIVLIYPFVTAESLKARVVKRAEAQASLPENKRLFRAVDPNSIDAQIFKAEMNLTHFVLPQLFVKNIDKVILYWNE